MDIDAYLDRIELSRRPEPTLDGLQTLHRAHLRAIPYEDLDVQLGRPVTIERPPIYDKIVGRRRGGWCYEMNGILGWALGELGFKVTRGTGGVMIGDDRESSLGNHLVLRVELDEGVYLADVGLSGGPLDPMPVAAGPFAAGGFSYSLERVDADWWRFHNDPQSGPPQFDFNLAPADETLFVRRCAELQTQDTSPFVQNLMCTRFVEGGVRVLLGRMLRTTTPRGREDERTLESADELVDTLAREFGLDAPEAASLWPKVCERHEAILAARSEAASAP